MTGTMPKLVSHVYWLRKESFLLASDVYEEWVLFVLEEGSFRYQIGEREESLAEPGDIVVCPPLHTFARETIAPVNFHFIRFTADTPPSLPAGKVRLSRQARLADDCARLRAHALGRSELSAIVRAHMLQDLWLMMLEESVAAAPQPGGLAAVNADPVMRAVKADLDEIAYRPLQLKEIAARRHMTPVQLTRRFQACFGLKPSEYVTDLRMRRAGELLTETNRTVEDIASACGYESGFYLSRVFAKHMGLSPSRYREKYRI